MIFLDDKRGFCIYFQGKITAVVSRLLKGFSELVSKQQAKIMTLIFSKTSYQK